MLSIADGFLPELWDGLWIPIGVLAVLGSVALFIKVLDVRQAAVEEQGRREQEDHRLREQLDQRLRAEALAYDETVT